MNWSYRGSNPPPGTNMANIYIFSQRQFNSVMSDMGWNDSTIDLINDTAIISICNTDGSMVHLFKYNHDNVLNLDFDDVEYDVPEMGIVAITPRQAKLIVDFFEKHIDAKNFIVHCEAGISRSAAVATCFMDFLHMNGIKGNSLHKNFSYHPNPRVERLIHQELSKRN